MTSLERAAAAFAVVAELVSIPLVSQSQITLFGECPRKWGWRYLEGIKTPSHPAAALGTEVDDTQLQPYLRDDRPFDFTRESGHIAASGLAYLPKPKTLSLEVQKHFLLLAPSGNFAFQGYIDLWLPNGGLPFNEADGTPGVTDFKTTGDLKRRQKSEAQLSKDVQAMLYAKWAMHWTGSPVIDLDWIYFATKGPRKAKRTHLRVLSSHVDEQYREINATAEAMFAIRKSGARPLDLPPTTSQCEAYGGCPYQSKCNLGPSDLIDAAAAQWRSRQETTHVSNTPQAGTAGLMARLKAQREGVEAPSKLTSELPAPATEAPAALPAWATAPVDPRRAVGINPPESALPPAPPVGSVPIPPPVEAAPSEEKAKRGPGRPRKAEPKDPVGADVNAFATPAPVAPRETASVIATFERTDEVTVTWAEETISPVAYNSFKVGPFTATGSVRKGETIPQACGRLYSELAAFAESSRAAKALVFKAAIEKMGVAR